MPECLRATRLIHHSAGVVQVHQCTSAQADLDYYGQLFRISCGLPPPQCSPFLLLFSYAASFQQATQPSSSSQVAPHHPPLFMANSLLAALQPFCACTFGATDTSFLAVWISQISGCANFCLLLLCSCSRTKTSKPRFVCCFFNTKSDSTPLHRMFSLHYTKWRTKEPQPRKHEYTTKF